MHDRLDLQNLLETLLGSREVYFDPPASVKMTYPAIVYHLKSLPTRHANNCPYLKNFVYEITLIDKRADSPYIEQLACLPTSAFERNYRADNLHHTIFTIFY